MAIDHPTSCPPCGCVELSWALHLTTGGIANGRLRLIDVSALAVLSCDACSETVLALDGEEALVQLAAPSSPLVVSTFDELEALPLGSIIASGNQVAVKTCIDSSANYNDLWDVTGVVSYEVRTNFLFSGDAWTVLRSGGTRG